MWPYMGGLNNRMKNFRLLYVILPFLGGSLRAVPRCKITIKMRNYGALVAMCGLMEFEIILTSVNALGIFPIHVF